jgi:tetratricopeptide (TPR) repeat protein
MELKPRIWALTLAGSILTSCAFGSSGGTEVEISRQLSRVRREPRNPRALIDLGAQFAIRASEQGYPSDVEDSRKYLRQGLAIDPQNALGTAWLGALRCIEAKIRGSKSFVHDGLRQLDQGVAMDSGNPRLRLLRGSVNLELPREYNRTSQALTDLLAVNSDPGAARAASLDMAEVHLKLGKAYRANGNMAQAQAMWRQVVAEAPSSREAASANKLLAKYGR